MPLRALRVHYLIARSLGVLDVPVCPGATQAVGQLPSVFEITSVRLFSNTDSDCPTACIAPGKLALQTRSGTTS